MGTEGACSCGGVGGRGCIEGEGPCVEDIECARVGGLSKLHNWILKLEQVTLGGHLCSRLDQVNL